MALIPFYLFSFTFTYSNTLSFLNKSFYCIFFFTIFILIIVIREVVIILSKKAPSDVNKKQ